VLLTWEDGRNNLDCTASIANDSNDFVLEVYSVVPCSAVHFVLKFFDPFDSGPFPIAIISTTIPLYVWRYNLL
jgi:hypothetical protein